MARTHNRVSSRIWTGRTARELRAYPLHVRLLQHWLMENESAVVEPYGLFHLQLDLAVLQIGAGITREHLENALGILERLEFCDYDPDSEWVWIREQAAHQVLEAYQPLKERDWRIRAAQKFYDSLPSITQLGAFFDHYVDLLRLTGRRDSKARRGARPSRPLEGASGGASEGASEAPKSTLSTSPVRTQTDLLEEEGDGSTALVLAAPRQPAQLEATMDAFEAWWELYPLKTGKGKARAAWLKHKPPVARLMDTTRAYLDSVQWAPKSDGGRAIPYPTTFLNNSMWEDTPTPMSGRDVLGSKNAAMVARTAGFGDE